MSNINIGLEINATGTEKTVADLKRVQDAVQGFKKGKNATAELAKILGKSEAEARKLARSLGLTETQVIEAAQAMNALKRAGASNEEVFKSLNRTMGISRKQFDGLSKVNISPKGLKQLQRQTKNLGGDMKGLRSGVNNVGQSAVQLASKLFLVVQALQAITAVGKGAFSLLIGQNEQVGQQLLGIQSTLAATNQVRVGGVEVTDPTEAILALEGPVNDALDRIRKGSLELVGVTSGQLVDTFRIVSGEAGGIGINLEQAADLSLDFAAALGTLGVPLNQSQQEIRSILQAQIDQNSIVAKSLNIDNEKVKSLKEQGKLYDFLREKLAAFRAGNALAANTVDGITSNIQELLEEFTRLSGEDITETLVLGLGEVFKFLEQNRDAILQFTQSAVAAFGDLVAIALDFGERVGDIFSEDRAGIGSLTDALADLGEGLGDNLAGLANVASLVAQVFIDRLTPAITLLVRIVDLALEGFGRIDDLIGQVNGSTDAAIEYGRQTEQASNQALKALEKQKTGDKDAAQAKRNAIAAVDDQIAVLKKANVAGGANRENIKTQVAELKRWRKALKGSAGDVDLVSNSTNELTNKVKQAEEEFKRLDSALGLENAQAQVDIYRDLEAGIISVEEANQRKAQAEQENIAAQIKGIDELIVKLEEQKKAALEKGDESKAKEFNDKIVANQTKQEKLILKATQARITEQNRLEKRAISEVKRTQDEALKQAQIAEQQRLGLIKQSGDSEKQRALAKLQSDRQTLQSQLQLNRAKQEELALLEATGEEAKALEKEKVNAQLEGAKIANQILDNERAAQQAALAVRLEAIDKEKQEADNLSKDRRLALKLEQQIVEDRAKKASQVLGAEIKQQQAIVRSLQTQEELYKAQAKLRSAQQGLQEASANKELGQINHAIDLQKRLNDRKLDPAVRREIEKQLRSLGLQGKSEKELLELRFAQENRIAAIKARQLEISQEAELRSLRLAQRRLELESKLGELKAKQAQQQAQLELDQAQARQQDLQTQQAQQQAQLERERDALAVTQESGSPEQIRAQEQIVADLQRALEETRANLESSQGDVELKQQNLQIVAQENALIKEDLKVKQEIGRLNIEALKANQKAAQVQQEAADSAREMAQALQLAEASARRGTPSARAKGGPVAKGQPYIVGEVGPELFIPGRSGQIISNAKLQALQPPTLKSAPGSRGLEKQMSTLIAANKSLNAQILRLASRQPLNQQNYNYYGASSAGLDLRGENL